MKVLPESPVARVFVLLTFIDSIGTGTFMASAVVFYVRAIGLTNLQIGAGLTIAGVVGLVMSVPMGVLGDQVGSKRLLVVMQFWRAVCFAALAVCHNVVVFVLIASALSVAESVMGALTVAFVGDVVGEDQRVRTMAVVRSVRNVGFSLGALLAALLTSANTGWTLYVIVLGNALSFVIAGVLLARIQTKPNQRAPSAPKGLAAIRGFRDWRYAGLAALNTLFSLHLSMLVIVIPLWIITATKAPTVIIAVLLLVNTLMAVFLQIPLSGPAKTVPGSRRLMTLAGLALAACSLMMVAASLGSAAVAVVLLVVGMAFMTLGEIWQSAAAWTLSYKFAPSTQRVQYLAIFGISGLLAQDVFGPFLLGGLVIDVGQLGWVALAVVFVLAVPLLRPLVTGLTRQERAGGVYHNRVPLSQSQAPDSSLSNGGAQLAIPHTGDPAAEDRASQERGGLPFEPLVVILNIDVNGVNDASRPRGRPYRSRDVFVLDRRSLVIGRDDAGTLEIPVRGDPYVSRRHAEILQLNDGWWIRDLGSTNGTKLNGIRLVGSEVKGLRPDDVVEFGRFSRLTVRNPRP